MANPTDLMKHLSGVNFPADRKALISHAEEMKAPDEVIKALKELPDMEYTSSAQVAEAVAERVE